MANYIKIWENFNGPRPKDQLGRHYDIHHIDGDRENNELSNLICVSIEDHYKIHVKQKDYMAAFIISQKINFSFNERRDIIQKMAETKKGKKHSEEAKQKMSESHKGKKHSDEVRQKMRKPRSEDAKSNMRESRIGKKHSDEVRQKMSESQKGRRLSEDHKQKLKILAIERWNKNKLSGTTD